MDFYDIGVAIKNTELRTWSDIERSQDRDHPIECHRLEKFAQDRLTRLQLDDNDELWSIRFNGRCRLWGIREGGLLQILWLDPQHEVCPSHKKHT